MAKIPEYDQLGARPSLSVVRPMARDNSGQILAEGAGAAARTVGAALEAREEKEQAFQYATARSRLLQADAEVRRKVREEYDYGQWNEKYEEELQRRVDEITRGIESPHDRRMFEAEVRNTRTRSGERLHEAAFAEEVEEGRNTLTGELDRTRRTALEADTAEERAVLLESAMEMIDAAQQEGYIADSEARKADFRHSYAVGWLDTLEPEQRVAALKKPENTPAEFLQPDERARALDAAETEAKEEYVRRDSQRAADDILQRHTGIETITDALAEARRIGDAEVRDATVTRIRQRYQEREMLLRQHRENILDSYLTRIHQGESLDTLRADVGQWGDLTPSQQETIHNVYAKKAAGGYIVTNRNRLEELRDMAVEDPAGFAALNLDEDDDQLAPGDKQKLEQIQAQIVTTMYPPADEAMQNEVLKSSLATIGVRTAGTDGKKYEEMSQREEAFRRKYRTEVDYLRQEKGREPTRDELLEIADSLRMQVVFDRDAWTPDDESEFPLAASTVEELEEYAENPDYYIPKGQIPQRAFDELSLALKSEFGRPAEEREVGRAWLLLEMGDAAGFERFTGIDPMLFLQVSEGIE